MQTKLNAIPQFVTEIDGQDIHFIHVRSNTKRRAAAHHYARMAWLDHRADEGHRTVTNPTAHGGNASDAFHLVIPSMPGYGYSPEPKTLGWDPIRIRRRGSYS